MDQADVRASGRITINADGKGAEDKFKIVASADVAKGGRVSLTIRPNFKPDFSKDGTNLSEPGNLAGLADCSDMDVNLSKSGVDIAGQSCDLTLDSQRVGQDNAANRLTVKTNVEQVGDVSLQLTQQGYTTDGKAAGANAAKVSVDLAKFVSDINKDVSASVDYDAAGKKATVNVGYKSGDASVKLKTSYDVDGQSASHKVNAGYTVEGIDAGLEINDKLNGEVTLAKDGFTLTVPFADKKVNQSDITLQKTWSLDLA